MGVTSKLLRLYRVDQQLAGLKSRLNAAERRLAAQQRQLDAARQDIESLESQARQLEAHAKNLENDSNAMDERIAMLRERMNQASTSKEHSALLVEINTIKADKSEHEDNALESLNQLEEVRAALAAKRDEIAQAEKIVANAATERDEREAEIKDRLAELEQQREEAKQDVPADALAIYAERLERDPDEAMAPVSEEDRRNMEYACGSCYTHLPIELVNKLLSRTGLVICPSCSNILYIEQDLHDSITDAAEKKRKKRETAATRD
jgi:predicted  nucleic acid-binding Zn-ribbon protein